MLSFWDVYFAVLHSTQTKFHDCKYFPSVELFQTLSCSSFPILIALIAVSHLQQPPVIWTASHAEGKERASNGEGETMKAKCRL